MLQLKAALLKSTAPWKLGVVQSDTLVDRQWSPTGRSMALLGGLVLKPDGETHASVPIVLGHMAGLGLQWAGADLGLSLNVRKRQGAMPAWWRGDREGWCPRKAASDRLWYLPEVLTQLKDE